MEVEICNAELNLEMYFFLIIDNYSKINLNNLMKNKKIKYKFKFKFKINWKISFIRIYKKLKLVSNKIIKIINMYYNIS